MDTSWISLLEQLQAASDDLSARQALCFASPEFQRFLNSSDGQRNRKDAPPQCPPFRIDDARVGRYLYSLRFDWRAHYGLSSNVCIYNLDNLFTGLMYYDTVIVFIYPCPERHFDLRHQFKRSDFCRLGPLCEAKRVVVVLAAQPLAYAPFEYLQALFERVRPIHVPWNPNRILPINESDRERDDNTDRITDRPGVRRAVMDMARANGEDFAATEVHILTTLHELYYQGYDSLRLAAADLLSREPAIGLRYLSSIKRLVINPIDLGSGIPHGWSEEDVLADYRTLKGETSLRNVVLPAEIGSILETRLSFPTPTNWDNLRWAEEHLDVAALRIAFEQLSSEAVKALSTGSTNIGQLKSTLEASFLESVASAGRMRKRVFWGASLALGATGAISAGPVVGLLTSLGLTVASNVTLDRLSDDITKRAMPSAFHLWRISRSGGRKPYGN